MKLVVLDHIPHHLEKIMSRQTKSFTLPILLKNEAKYEDCVSIMDSYNQQMSDWYRKAGRTEAAMEYFGIQDPNSSPTKHGTSRKHYESVIFQGLRHLLLCGRGIIGRHPTHCS
ncbi:hypothetical protein DPMN_135154 [Dreissena polymorpha]|uniref:Uncharacterized protein n=1 Tax=Dreissena polymorpha TaxID=45954 RepID=A0A9D4JBC9_DREPO|nr:hypothetical protein DPMN_135154 [Dreissena polymorpha]